MGAAPFSYPPRPGDRLLAAAGQAERLARALVRRLRTGGLRSVAGEALRAGRAGPPEPSPTPAGAPILYLPAVAWGYRVQRPQHLARALARAGHPVLYIEGFLRSRLLPERRVIAVSGGVTVLRVRVPGRPDPFRTVLDERTAARLAGTVLSGLGPARPLFVLVQLPFWAALGRALANRLGCPLVYDRIDLHAGFPGVPPAVAAAETELLGQADLVTASSRVLAGEPGTRALLLPNAVDLPSFPFSPPRAPGAPPCAGYVGALGPWFDVEAVRQAAVALPGWRFRLAGRVEEPAVAALAALPNVELLGEIPFGAVPGFLAGLAAALVPFRDLPLTRAVDPVKLYEALAAGLPVVARRLPETARWDEPLVYLYDAAGELPGQLARAVEEQSPGRAAERRRAAEGGSWDARARSLLAAIPTAGGSAPGAA